METDELRGIAREAVPGADPGAAGRRTRWAWLRSYVRHRVDERLEPGALGRALDELHTEPVAPVTDGD